jgi:hypothetical protein
MWRRTFRAHGELVVVGPLSNDWEQFYGHPVYFFTSPKPPSIRAVCAGPAIAQQTGNCLGLVQSAARTPQQIPNRSKKVLGYPLTPRFRELLSQ